MDIASILGFIIGIGVMVMGIMTTGKLLSYYDIGSIYITIGGTIGTLLIAFPFSSLKNVGKAMLKAFFPPKIKPQTTINNIVELAEIARKNGLLSLEKKGNECKDPFLKNGISVVMETNEPDKVREVLETDLSFMEARHKAVINIFDKGGSFAPAFGMIGTLIGLINMLLNLDKPETLGPNMSVALITTFYGAVMANVIFIPMANKLRLRNDEEVLDKQIIIEGLIAIQSGDNPRMIKEKLQCFLSPKQRGKAENPAKKVGNLANEPKNKKKR